MKFMVSTIAFICMVVALQEVAISAVDSDIQALINAKKDYVKEFAVPVEKAVNLYGFVTLHMKKTGVLTDINVELVRGNFKINLNYIASHRARLHGEDSDITDTPLLIAKLQNDSNPATKAISQYLWERLDPATRQLLLAPNTTLAQRQSALIQGLNAILEGASIYESTRFAGVSLLPQTQSLIALRPSGDTLARQNRLLLEDAYSPLIKRTWELPGHVAVESADGNHKDFILNDYGSLIQYYEGKNGKPDGVFMDFRENGNIEYYIEFKNGYYFGRQIRFDENGKELERIKNDGSKKLEIDK